MSSPARKEPNDLHHYEDIGGRWVEMGDARGLYRAKPAEPPHSDDVTVSLADDETYKTFRNLQPGPEKLEGM